MSEEKSVRQLERELKAARIREGREQRDRVPPSRDYSIGGIDKPDAILLPKKQKNRKENIPF